MRRREVLGVCGATVGTMLAGCTDNPGGGEEPGEEIVRFSVINEDEEYADRL